MKRNLIATVGKVILTRRHDVEFIDVFPGVVESQLQT
jgi:hypothetical protein